METQVATGVVAILWIAIHLFSDRLKFLDELPRSRWLSTAGGISVAYVFVHILPELNERQTYFEEKMVFSFVEHHIYLIALLGLLVFYCLEIYSQGVRDRKSHHGDERDGGVFWLHLVVFLLYNTLIAYLLFQKEHSGLISLTVYGIALGLHFLVVDHGLREHYKAGYLSRVRWLLCLTVVLGFVIEYSTDLSEGMISPLFAFLSGAIILNVIKEELPSERQTSMIAFPLSAVIFSGLMMFF